MADNQSRNTDIADLDAGSAPTIYRADYTASAYLIERTELDFQLHRDRTIVRSCLSIVRNTQANADKSDGLILQGSEMVLNHVSINGQALAESDYHVTATTLTIRNAPEKFKLETEVEIKPAENLSLEGLYQSDGMYCTQCEAEGFRRITYYLDRPDVMSTFTTRIEADQDAFPVLLSNGNKTDQGTSEDGRHWVQWHDPFKKPCYLFALVAGDLAVLEDQYTTMSGREVKLEIFAEAKDLDKCDHAMDSLKRSMQWDEQVYGREYDLDLYMIVAVSFFNMGAMENKGLNIFNTSCVLAHPKTQTDAAFQRVEAVVAHEYFHNWSGNRVTCRDWFQLSLKEGFTVFRDACFSADMNSYTVKRIEDVNLLRSAQFAEDAGPMAHSIRPDSYQQISNFYTLTIYEKGAEIIRMQHALLGAETFRAGTDLYFDRHDGQAVTCEDFVVAMEDASGVDLGQFRHWYSQAGTPVVEAEMDWDDKARLFSLTLKQSCPPSPGQPQKDDFQIPIAIGFVDESGYRQDCEQILDLNQSRQSWEFNQFECKPVLSLLRGFSAPVKLTIDYSYEELVAIVQHETDGYSRWDAAQRFLTKLLHDELGGQRQITSAPALADLNKLIDCFETLLADGLVSIDDSAQWDNDRVDAAMMAELLRPPGFALALEQIEEVDVAQLHGALKLLRLQIAESMELSFRRLFEVLDAQLKSLGSYKPDPLHVALRSLKNYALSSLLLLGKPEDLQRAREQFDVADNMTDQFAALSAVVLSGHHSHDHESARMLEAFYQQWSDEQLVVNQWLGLQAMSDKPEVIQSIKTLSEHSAYDAKNPNQIRALISGFASRNPAQFHQLGGAGYRLLAAEVLRVDGFNPQIAARLVSPLTAFSRYAAKHRDTMLEQLRWLAEQELSPDLSEVVGKSLV